MPALNGVISIIEFDRYISRACVGNSRIHSVIDQFVRSIHWLPRSGSPVEWKMTGSAGPSLKLNAEIRSLPLQVLYLWTHSYAVNDVALPT
jgi:hypothetical protein